MSVDFTACDCCGDALYEECVGQTSCCHQSVCVYCLVNKDVKGGYIYNYRVKWDGTTKQLIDCGYDEEVAIMMVERGDIEEGETIDDVGIDEKYCPFCSGGVLSDDEFMQWLIYQYNQGDIEALKEQCKQDKKDKKGCFHG